MQGRGELFEEYEDSFQTNIYCRFKQIYRSNEHENPTDYDEEQEESARQEKKQDPLTRLARQRTCVPRILVLAFSFGLGLVFVLVGP